MNIQDTINEVLKRVEEVDALEGEYDRATEGGEEIKAHCITQGAMRIANEIGQLVEEMDDSDFDDVKEEIEMALASPNFALLAGKGNDLQKALMDLSEAERSDNILNTHRLLREIAAIGQDITKIATEGAAAKTPLMEETL